MALMLITHDLGVVAEIAQRVVVMYAGQVVETGRVPEIFDAPQPSVHEALLAALPEHNIGRGRLQTIPGVVPGQYDRPAGCLLAPRCAYAQPRCRVDRGRCARPGAVGLRSRAAIYPLDREGRPDQRLAAKARLA